MKLYYPITVDLYNPHPLPRMNAQQHNVGRGALITLTANGQIIVPDEEAVRIFAKRPDKNTSYLDCSILEGKIQADFTDQMLASEGIVEVELELTTAETNITTPIFIVEVNKSNVKEGVQSSNEYKALEKYTAEAKEAAEQAQEVYDNIPNYEAILEANSILSKASGEVVTTTDSAKVKPKNIKLFGKGKQRQYEGNQLLNIPINWNNGNVSIVGDGATFRVISASCDVEYSNLKVFDDLFCFEAGETYSINRKETYMHLGFWFYDSEGNIAETLTTEGTNNKTKTIPNDVVRVTMYFAGLTTGSSYDFEQNFMVNKGEPKDWEPFVGNKPSPSMEYPQPIESLENVEVKVLGKNFLDESTISGQCAGGFSYHFDNPLFLKGGQSYTIKMYGHTVNPQLFSVYRNNTGIKDLFAYPENIFADVYDKDTLTFTLEEDTCCVIRAWWADNNNIPPLDSVRTQLELGTVATEYEPYKEPQTLPIPYVLRGTQVTDPTIANYTDSEGKLWVADYVSFGDKEYVQWIMYERVDSAQLFEYNSTDTYTRVSTYQFDACVNNSKKLCNYFRWSEFGVINSAYVGIGSGKVSFFMDIEKYPTAEDVIAFFENNEVYFMVILAEPICTPLTDEQLEAYKQLYTNYPTTTIMTNNGAELEVEYVADTKEHIKQNYVAKSEHEALKERVSEIENVIANL